MPEVPRQRSPATEAELAAVLVRAHAAVFGAVPTRKRATLLLSQWFLETGRGKSIFNNNVGNLTATNQSTQNFWRPPWFEAPPYDEADTAGFGSDAPRRLERLHELMLQGKAPSAFRAFVDLEEGATAYMRLLRSRYPGILKAATTGSARQFATAVHSEGYCPDPECHPDKTTASFASLQKEINRAQLFRGLPSGDTVTTAALVLVPLAIWGALQWAKKA